MNVVSGIAAAVMWLAAVSLVGGQENAVGQNDRAYLTWTSNQAQQIGRRTRVNGRVGGALDFRLTHTERSFNYKLRATWLTGDVIRATARLAQLAGGLSNESAEALVRAGESAGEIVIMVEIDPNEGSGVIPLDWTALLGPEGWGPGQPAIVKGTSLPRLRDVRALSGVFDRDYDYEVFWLAFPVLTEAGVPLFPETVRAAELAIRIQGKEGRVKWPIPESIRRR